MGEELRSHLSYANVVATICLFSILAGGTASALTIQNNDLDKLAKLVRKTSAEQEANLILERLDGLEQRIDGVQGEVENVRISLQEVRGSLDSKSDPRIRALCKAAEVITQNQNAHDDSAITMPSLLFTPWRPCHDALVGGP